LNAFFTRIKNDDRLKATDVSLYLALFQYWNFNRFQNPFPVYRDNIIQLSKLGSKNTYHKSIKLLHQAGYIIYHPALAKYQPVKISIVPLDIKEQSNSFMQWNLFSNEQVHVPNLTDAGINNDTPQVPNSGHYIKPNNLKNSVGHTPTKNEKMESGKENNSAQHVPKLRHVSLQEIEEFFQANNYGSDEAKKFFYYNQSKNWMLTDKIPICDWKSLAHKWMLNDKEVNTEHVRDDNEQTIQYLYERFLEGERINKYLLPQYADHLELQVTEAIYKEAIQRRLNQLSGSNENSKQHLWKAYMSEDFTNDLLVKDEANLIALAKRIAVAKHFQKLKASGTKHVVNQHQS
jgi:hypothetical protein